MSIPNDYLLRELLSTQQRHQYDLRLKQASMPQLPGHIVHTTACVALPDFPFSVWDAGIRKAIETTLITDLKIRKVGYNKYDVSIPTWIHLPHDQKKIAYWSHFEIRPETYGPIPLMQLLADFSPLQPHTFVNTTAAEIELTMRQILDAFGIHSPTSVKLQSMRTALKDFAEDYAAKFRHKLSLRFSNAEGYQKCEPSPSCEVCVMDPHPQHVGAYSYLVASFGGHYRSIPLGEVPWIEELVALSPEQLWLRFLDLLKSLATEEPYYARLRTDILQLGKDDNWSSQPDHYFRTAALTAVM